MIAMLDYLDLLYMFWTNRILPSSLHSVGCFQYFKCQTPKQDLLDQVNLCNVMDTSSLDAETETPLFLELMHLMDVINQLENW